MNNVDVIEPRDHQLPQEAALAMHEYAAQSDEGNTGRAGR